MECESTVRVQRCRSCSRGAYLDVAHGKSPQARLVRPGEQLERPDGDASARAPHAYASLARASRARPASPRAQHVERRWLTCGHRPKTATVRPQRRSNGAGGGLCAFSEHSAAAVPPRRPCLPASSRATAGREQTLVGLDLITRAGLPRPHGGGGLESDGMDARHRRRSRRWAARGLLLNVPPARPRC